MRARKIIFISMLLVLAAALLILSRLAVARQLSRQVLLAAGQAYPGIAIDAVEPSMLAVTLSGVRWQSGRHPGVGFTADRVRVGTSVRHILRALRAKDPFQTVSSIDVDTPSVKIGRSSSGEWLLPLPEGKRTGRPARIWSTLAVRQAEVQALDEKGTGSGARRLKINDLSLRADIKGEMVAFEFDGSSDRIASFSSSGWSSLAEPLFSASVKLKGCDIPFIGPYLFGKSLQVKHGSMDVRAKVSGTPQPKGFRLDYAGSADLHKVDVASGNGSMAVNGINGSLDFDADGARSKSLKMVYKGLPLQAAGSVTDLSDPRLDLVISGKDIPLQSASRLVGLPVGMSVSGKAGLQMRLRGNRRKPVCEGVFAVDGLKVSRRDVGKAGGMFQYSGGILRLPQLQAESFPGNMAAMMDLRSGRRRGLLIYEYRNLAAKRLVDLNLIERSAWMPEGGRLSGRLLARFQGASLSGANLLLQGQDLVVQGLPCPRAAMVADHRPGLTRISDLSLDFGKGAGLRLSGEIRDGLDMDLDVEGLSVPLGRFLDLPTIGGRKVVTVSGRIKGKPGSITFNGLANGGALEYGGFNFEGFIGGMAYDEAARSVTLQNVYLRSKEISARISGSISPREIDLDGRLQSFDTVLLSRLVGEKIGGTLQGSLSGTFTVGGSPEAPTATAILRADDFLLLGAKMDDLVAGLDWDGKDCNLESLALHWGDGVLEVSGRVGQGTYDLEMGGSRIPLKSLRALVPSLPDAEAAVDFDGMIRGPLDSPANVSGEMTMVAEKFSVAGGEAGTVRLSGTASKGRAGYKLDYEAASGSLGIKGDIDFNRWVGTLEAEAADMPWKQIEAVVRSLRPHISGTQEGAPGALEGLSSGLLGEDDLKGSLVNGSLRFPEINYRGEPGRMNLQLKAAGGRLLGHDIQQLSVGGAFYQGRFFLDEAELTGPDFGRISVDGWGDVSGPQAERRLSLQLNAENVDLPAMARLQPESFSSRISLSGKVDGTWKAPVLTGSFSSAPGKLYGYGFESIKGGIQADSRGMKLQEVSVSRGIHQALIDGYLPFDWKEMKVPADREMELDASLAQGDLSLAALFFPGVTEASGSVEAILQLQGRPDRPDIIGRAVIGGGQASVAGLGRITDLQTVLAFNGDSMDVQVMAFNLGGGRVTGGGRISLLKGGSANSVVNLQAANAGITLPVFQGRVDGEINLFGDEKGPRIEGGLKVREGSVYLQQGGLQSVPWPKSSAHLNIAVNLKEGIRLVGDNIKATCGGDLLVGGTVTAPVITGEIVSRQGEIELSSFSAPFRVVDARAVFSEGTGSKPLLPSLPRLTITLTARATSRIAETQVFMDVGGQLPEIQVELSSRPEMSEDEIIALIGRRSSLEALVGGKLEDVVKNELVRLLSASIRQQIFDPVGRSLAEAFDLNEITFDYDDQETFSMRLGRYILDGLYFSYTTTIFGSRQHNVMQVDYFLKNNITLSWTNDDTGQAYEEIRWQYRF